MTVKQSYIKDAKKLGIKVYKSWTTERIKYEIYKVDKDNVYGLKNYFERDNITNG